MTTQVELVELGKKMEKDEVGKAEQLKKIAVLKLALEKCKTLNIEKAKLVFNRMRSETRKQAFVAHLLYDITVWYEVYNYQHDLCLKRKDEITNLTKVIKDANETMDRYPLPWYVGSGSRH